MGEFLRALSAVFLIFSLMGMGYVLGRFKWLTSSEKKFLSRYVVNIAVPMNCLVGVLNHLKREDLASMGSLLLVPVLCILLSLLLLSLIHISARRRFFSARSGFCSAISA